MTEKVKEMLHQTTRTWYGVPVDITVSSDHWHRVVVPGLALPHPGLVNLFARWGLPADERLVLTYRHELGHLQTLPVPLVHLFLILWPRRGRRGGSCWLRALVGLVAHQAASLDIYKAARDEGLRTLKEAAIEKVFRGTTTTTEMVRVTGR